MRAAATAHGGHDTLDADIWREFAHRLFYLPASFDDPDAYDDLRARLEHLRRNEAGLGNRLFYLATAPTFFPVIAEHLGAAGLSLAKRTTRLRGSSSRSRSGATWQVARILNERVGAVFGERQTYRIDHYLGKETVQNLLVLRFANAIFEPVWNRRYVDHVQITVAEDLGVETRGGYYDQSGALRDIVQNHIFQVLSLVAMEPPARFDSRSVHDEKVKVLRAIPEISAEHAHDAAVRGQYGRATSVGNRSSGTGPNAASTPIRTRDVRGDALTVDNWRWAGTPFYLRTGKRLPRRATEVAIQFKPAPHMLFAPTAVEATAPNRWFCGSSPRKGSRCASRRRCPGHRSTSATSGWTSSTAARSSSRARRPTSACCSTPCSATRPCSPAG